MHDIITRHRCYLRRPDVAVHVARHLLVPRLYVQFVVKVVHPQENELALPVERVLDRVERDDVRIAEDGGNPRRLVADAVLRGSPLESESFAAHGLLVLPQTAKVHGRHVVVPLRQRRHFAALGPGQVTEVVATSRFRAPLLVVRQHEVAILVVAALLLRALETVTRN